MTLTYKVDFKYSNNVLYSLSFIENIIQMYLILGIKKSTKILHMQILVLILTYQDFGTKYNMNCLCY